MAHKILAVVGLILTIVVAYLLVWPVPVKPVAWQAPAAPGYVGPFARNERLKGLEMLPLADNHGPETVALDAQGRIYAATHEGRIVRLRAAPDATVTTLAIEAHGAPILYANSVDVAADGKIYFSDASTKFGAKQWGGTYPASLLDILEHGSHGRLLVYDPATGKATTLVAGLNFANGVAIAHDQRSVLVNETGTYRVLRHWIAGPRQGRTEPLIENLPGFPDNLSTGLDGRFWLGLISPRNTLVDRLSGALRAHNDPASAGLRAPEGRRLWPCARHRRDGRGADEPAGSRRNLPPDNGRHRGERPYLCGQLDDARAGPAAEGQRRALKGAVGEGLGLGYF
jgi:sugar lactone lactonase YvrE